MFIALPEYELASSGPSRVLLASRQYQTKTTHINNPDDAALIALMIAAGRPMETAHIILLDAKNRVLGTSIVGIGDSRSVSFSIESIVTRALLCTGCTAVIVCHNHLHSDPEPSDDDLDTFSDLLANWPREVVALHDFCITTAPGGFYSFRRHSHFD